MRHVFTVILLVSAASASDDKPLTPVEARKQVGKEIAVKMEVKTAKDRLEKRGEITSMQKTTSRTRRISRSSSPRRARPA